MAAAGDPEVPTSNDLGKQLIDAIYNNNTDAALHLIDAGASLVTVDENDTPFAAACRNKNSAVALKLIEKDVVRKLSDKGIDVFGSTLDKHTPLMVACRFGLEPVVRALLAKGVDINAKSNLGTTALIEACAEKHSEIALLLLEHDASVHGSSRVLESAYNQAKNKMPDVFTALVERGATSSGIPTGGMGGAGGGAAAAPAAAPAAAAAAAPAAAAAAPAAASTANNNNNPSRRGGGRRRRSTRRSTRRRQQRRRH